MYTKSPCRKSHCINRNIRIKTRRMQRNLRVPAEKRSRDLAVFAFLVEPLPARKRPAFIGGLGGDDDVVEQPTGTKSGVVVSDFDAGQFAEVERFDDEIVGLISFEEVATLALERTGSGVAVPTVHAANHVGVGSAASFAAGYHGDHVFHGADI